MIFRPENSGPAASPRAALRRSAVAGLALAALVLAGCGGRSSLVADGTTVAPAGTVPFGASPGTVGVSPDTGVADPSPPSGPNGALPSLPVFDVATGAKVDLAKVPPPDRPLLVWFWAPH